MPDSEYFCRYCGTRLGRVRINDYGAHKLSQPGVQGGPLSHGSQEQGDDDG